MDTDYLTLFELQQNQIDYLKSELNALKDAFVEVTKNNSDMMEGMVKALESFNQSLSK